MKKILYSLLAGLFMLSITSCHDKRMKSMKKPRKESKREVKYYKDTPEYKRQMRDYDRCKDPTKCPDKFERSDRRW